MPKPLTNKRQDMKKGVIHMKTMFHFMKTMMLMPPLWRMWLGLLVGANMLVPFVYIHTLEAQVVLVAAMAGMVIMSAIFGTKGYVRLLGIGHITWLPLVFWLWTRLDHAPADSFFGYWVMTVIIVNSLSLIIDTLDVIRYVRGERAPVLGLPAQG